MLKIAHRGASAYEPENTLKAFVRGLEMGANAIELDVHLAKTGEIVVIHDETVNRTTDGKGKVADKSLYALKELLIAEDQRIPTLQEVLDLVDNRAVIFIETKVRGIAKQLGELIESAIHSHKWQREKLIVISFDIDELRELKKHFPKILVGPTLGEREPIEQFCAKVEGLSPYSINLNIDIAHKKMVKAIHARGQKVFVWTANKPEQIAYGKELGVDGIMSDYPDRL